MNKLQNISTDAGIEWYRFGQKKGSLLARDAAFRKIFVEKFSERIKEFNFVINDYRYSSWVHYISKADVDIITKNFLQILMSVNNLSLLLDQSNSAFKDAIKELNQFDLSDRVSKSQLLSYFNKFVYHNGIIESCLVCSNFIVRTLSWAVEESLSSVFPQKDENQIKEIAMSLVFNETKSVFLKRQIDLWKLAVLRRNNQLKDSHVANFIKEYEWVGMMFLIFRPLTAEDVTSEINSVSDPERELGRIEQVYSDHIRERNNWLKEINPDQNFSHLIDLLKESSLVETEVLKNFQLFQFRYYDLLGRIAQKLSIDYNHLIYCTVDEISVALEKHQPFPKLSALDQRDQIGFSFFLHDGQIKMDFPFENDNKLGDLKEVKGMCASRGLARGTVRVVFDINQIDKVKEGDILVTGMTTPNFVVAMKRAGAIVTNDGGITCHAGIVSRELGKPCVIGTKIATEVLRDGDLVEVDANSGIVKKLN